MSKYCPAYPPPLKSRWAWLWRALTGRDSLLEQLTETAYRMHMGRVPAPGHEVYVVNDPATVRRVLVEEHDTFPKHHYMHELLEPLLGDSIFTSNGEPWAQQRRMMEPAFEQTRMERVFPLMRDAADALMERLRNTSGRCDIEVQMTHFTADVIFRTIFSRPLAAGDADRIFRAFAVFQKAAPRATMPRYRPRWWPHPLRARHTREMKEAALEIRALLREQVAPRHAAFHAGAATGGGADILASLLEARHPQGDRPLGVEEVVNEIAVLYLAGHETSASALSWTLHVLAHDSDVQSRVHAELDARLAPGPVELASLRDLELLRRVFRETLRLYPPLGFLVREAAQPTCLRSREVPVGTTVVISPWLMHRHRQYWERPDEFDPDRFATAAGRASAASAYLPFSMGPRVCVGAGFALQEAALALASVLREFSVAPLAGEAPMPVARLSLRSDVGIRLALLRR
jgi:cytochrome P450